MVYYDNSCVWDCMLNQVSQSEYAVLMVTNHSAEKVKTTNHIAVKANVAN